jgi:hypothetical protein
MLNTITAGKPAIAKRQGGAGVLQTHGLVFNGRVPLYTQLGGIPLEGSQTREGQWTASP